jgi:hypothetical protein
LTGAGGGAAFCAKAARKQAARSREDTSRKRLVNGAAASSAESSRAWFAPEGTRFRQEVFIDGLGTIIAAGPAVFNHDFVLS